MSYCRFSSDYFNCDLYVYEDFTGSYCIHVAGSRYIFDRSPIVEAKNADEFVANHDYVMDALETARVEEITLPFAGESFYFFELSDAIDKVEELERIGYNIPSTLISNMKKELYI